MKLVTKHFGEIEVDENIILHFEHGILGVTNSKRFILLADDGIFYWLQSIDEPAIAFVMMDVLKYLPDYEPLVDVEETASLGEFEPEDLLVYNIVVIPENIKKLSVNLKAPVVINDKTKRGAQIIANNEEYPIRYLIFEELNAKK